MKIEPNRITFTDWYLLRTHSIWFDFNPHKAKYVILALSDVNAKSKISTTITHNSLDNYHAYFARQSSFRT